MRKGVMVSLIGVVLAGALLAAIGVSGRERMPEPDNRVPRVLNTFLTNEMTDSLGLSYIDKEIADYLSFWHIRGLSLTVTRNDSLIFSKGYGWAEKAKKEKMTPGTIMRVASVSKLITAAGIMVLQEQGKLTLKDKVFGPNGILCDSTYTAVIKDSAYFDITVEHLLRHQGGFSSRRGDPMFSTLTIMQQNRLKTPPDHETLVKLQLPKELYFAPGTWQEYSNFGFLLLSMIIEKVTGESYEDWMQANVLERAGCHDFHLAENYLSLRRENETRYYVQDDDKPVEEYNRSGRMVTRCYGGNDIKALSGAGAWVCSTPELARFVASIDGRPWVPDIISEESVRQMTEYFDTETFSLGWNDTNPDNCWARSGTFSGTSALIRLFPDGECWILVTNTSTWKGPRQAGYTAELFKRCRENCSAILPARDLFYE